MPLIIRWLLNAAALMLAATIMGDSVRLSGLGAALGASALIGLLNVVIKPFLLLLTLPLNILTLGLFTFVINAMIILLASSSDPNGWFYVAGFVPALGAALILSLVSWLISYLTGGQDQPRGQAYFYVRRNRPGGPPPGPSDTPRPRVDSEDTIDLSQDSDGKWK